MVSAGTEARPTEFVAKLLFEYFRVSPANDEYAGRWRARRPPYALFVFLREQRAYG